MKAERRTIYWSALLLALAVLLGSALSMVGLYQAALGEEKTRLRELVQSQVRLIEALARFSVVQPVDYPGGPPAAVLSQLRDLEQQPADLGQTGEFMLARLEGDRVVYLLDRRYAAAGPPGAEPPQVGQREPMQLALTGQTGTMIGPDYRGTPVLAAYAPVPALGWGVVAKIDLREVQAPFARAGLAAGLAALVISLSGAVLFVRLTRPLLGRVAESERRYRTLFENAPVSLWEEDFSAVKTYLDQLRATGVTDLRAYLEAHPAEVARCAELVQIVDVNQATVEFYEAPDKRRFQQGLAAYVAEPEIRALFREELLALAAGQLSFECEMPARTFGGRRKYVAFHLALAPGHTARWDKVLVSFVDVTQRREAEAKLSESEWRFQEMLENVRLLAVMLDRQGHVIFCNDYLLDLTGWTQAEVLGRDWFKLFVPPELEVRQVFADRLAQAGIPPHYENEIVTRSGARRLIAWNNTLLRTSQGEIMGTTSLGEDITEARQAEQALQTAYAQIQAQAEELTAQMQALADTNRDLQALNTAVQASEARYRQLVDNLGEGMGVVSPADEFVFANPVAETLFGVERGGLAGHSLREFTSPDQFVLAQVQSSWRQKGEVSVYELEIRRPDHQKRQILVTATPQFDAAGAFVNTLGIFRDITERKRAEAELRQTTEELDGFFSLTLDLLCIANLDGYFLRLNPAWETTLGYPLKDLVGHRFMPLVHPEDVDRTQAVMADLGGQKEVLNFANRYRHQDGSYRWIEWRLHAQGQRIYAAARDITERKQWEEKIIRAKQEWERTFDAVPDLIAIISTDHRLMRVNRAMAARLGLEPRDCVGRPCYACMHGAEAPLALCPHTQSLQDHQSHTAEIYEERLGGYFVVTTSPLHDSAGQLLGSVHVAFDITERKQAEEQLRTALQEKEVLLREVYHRVKNNLQVISSLLELQTYVVSDPQVQQALQDSQNRVRAMALVHQHLYQSGNLTAINAAEYLQSLIGYLSNVYALRTGAIDFAVTVKAELTLNLDEAVPCGLIINELVTNAIQYAFPPGRPAGAGRVWVTLGEAEAWRYSLTVGDNGVGLAPEWDIDRAPSMGFQVVKALVRQLHGQLEVKRGDGVEFEITFPKGPLRRPAHLTFELG